MSRFLLAFKNWILRIRYGCSGCREFEATLESEDTEGEYDICDFRHEPYCLECKETDDENAS